MIRNNPARENPGLRFREASGGGAPDAAWHLVAELETENAALRRALADAGGDAGRAAARQGADLARERAGRAADAAEAREASAGTEARHGLAMAAGRDDLAASEASNAALRRANSDLEASRAALRESEERLRLILDSTADYAIFSTDLERRVASWNAGAERLLGWSGDEIVGRSADVIFTAEDRGAGAPEEEGEGALHHGRAADERWHRRKDGTRFWANGLMLPLRDPEAGPASPPIGLLKILRDETERRRAQERLAALVEVGDRLRDLRDTAEIAGVAETVGRALGAARAGYGTVDAAEELFRVERDWTDGRVGNHVGTYALSEYWDGFAGELRRGEVVVVGDVERDGRTAGDAARAFAAAESRAFVNVPVVEAGRVTAILYVQDLAPRRWSAEEVAFLRGVADRIRAAVQRVRAGARRDALLDLGDRLRDLRDPGEIARTAAEVIGRALGASRAGYGALGIEEDGIRIERDWTGEPSAGSVAGSHRLSDYWPGLVGALRRDGVVAVGDVARDPRTAPHADRFAALGVRACVHAPVVDAGRVAALLFVHAAEARDWSAEEVAFVREAADRAWAAAERARAEGRRALLVAELNHRVKNTLAVVQALALQTARGAPDLPAFTAAFQARLVALARAHDLLTRENWEGAALGAVVRAALAPSGEARVDLGGCGPDGPLLAPPQALALALALHELGTNALKHGALSTPNGRVSIVCRGDPGDGAPVVEWLERGGPRIAGPPVRRGFGLRLLDRGLAMQAGVAADLRFEPDGLRCELRLPPAL